MDEPIRKAYQFLFVNGQSIIRNEAAIALGLESNELRQEMFRHPQVQYWIDCSQAFLQKPQIHNAADICLENWMHKLLSFGNRENDDERLVSLNAGLIKYVKENLNNDFFFNSVNNTITASWLICMGHDEPILIDIILQRIKAIHEFVSKKDYNIHVSPKHYPSIPKSRSMHPLVNPDLYEKNLWKLPTVHDMFAFANLPPVLAKDDSVQKKINDIVEYVLDERYQKLYRGYGLMLVPPRTYYSMGWSVHLEHYFEDPTPVKIDGVVWMMELMSHFKPARQSGWFQRTLSHLEQFCEEGLYEFPVSYMTEGKDMYYVLGRHMGLGENRRNKLGLKLESTAWMLRILSRLG